MKKSSALVLGEAIVKRRKSLGVTQRDAATLAGCSEPFLVRLEAGKTTARLDKVIDVINVLGLELWLTAGVGEIVVDPEL